MLIVIIAFQYYRAIVLISDTQKAAGELCFPQTQHVKTSKNFFEKTFETNFYEVWYNPQMLISVSDDKSHTSVGNKPSECEGWSEQPLPVPCHGGVTPKGWGWWLCGPVRSRVRVLRSSTSVIGFPSSLVVILCVCGNELLPHNIILTSTKKCDNECLWRALPWIPQSVLQSGNTLPSPF